jgi:hypothetical protein
MIEIPRITKPDSGLVFRKPIWHALYYVDEATRTRSLGTADKEEAREARNTFYQSLRNEGAVERSLRNKAQAGSDTYIRERPKFVVKVPGFKLRQAATIEQAREIRDAMLGKNTPAHPPR